jgi:hypothetical protein
MSTKSNANLKAIELTQAELDSVTGGATFNEQIHQYAKQHAAETQKIANYSNQSW